MQTEPISNITNEKKDKALIKNIDQGQPQIWAEHSTLIFINWNQ